MATTQDALLLREAVNAAKSGNKAGARQMLRQASVYNPNNELVWLWRASLAETPKEAMFFLGEVLRINPKNEKASQWLEKCKPHVESKAPPKAGDPGQRNGAVTGTGSGVSAGSAVSLHQAISGQENRTGFTLKSQESRLAESRLPESRPAESRLSESRLGERVQNAVEGKAGSAKEGARSGESAATRLAEATARLLDTTRMMPRSHEATAKVAEAAPRSEVRPAPSPTAPAAPKPPEAATAARSQGTLNTTPPSQAKKPSVIPFSPAVKSQQAGTAAPVTVAAPPAPMSKWRCPFCNQGAEAALRRCSNCRAVTVLEDLKEVEKNEGAVERMLRDAIARLEQVKPDQRKFEHHLNLALAHLNLREATQAIPHLKAACALQRNNWNLLGILDQIQWRKVVLVVDDSLTVRKALSSILEKNQYRVVLAEDGSHALNRLNEAVPDLVLLDITMPFMDGYQVCKVIKDKAVTKKVPVVMLSGKDGLFDKVRGKLAGANDYVTKPFDPDNLLKVIRKYLGGNN